VKIYNVHGALCSLQVRDQKEHFIVCMGLYTVCKSWEIPKEHYAAELNICANAVRLPFICLNANVVCGWDYDARITQRSLRQRMMWSGKCVQCSLTFACVYEETKSFFLLLMNYAVDLSRPLHFMQCFFYVSCKLIVVLCCAVYNYVC